MSKRKGSRAQASSKANVRRSFCLRIECEVTEPWFYAELSYTIISFRLAKSALQDDGIAGPLSVASRHRASKLHPALCVERKHGPHLQRGEKQTLDVALFAFVCVGGKPSQPSWRLCGTEHRRLGLCKGVARQRRPYTQLEAI